MSSQHSVSGHRSQFELLEQKGARKTDCCSITTIVNSSRCAIELLFNLLMVLLGKEICAIVVVYVMNRLSAFEELRDCCRDFKACDSNTVSMAVFGVLALLIR
ncbi:hypothetical protein Droror1_Dr00004351 [Drosera rotundifolia]